jgi:Ser/Thr protein kinase RdoA (MazF antagonist)
LPHLIKKSTHNDLNPNNILFDGKKTYLINWEAAGLDDPFIDLAIVCNNFIIEPSLQNHFLAGYFAAQPTSEQLEKLHWMRQISYAYYALHFLSFAAEAGLALLDENIDSIPDVLAWKVGYQGGLYSLKAPLDFLLYGMVQVKMSLQQMK